MEKNGLLQVTKEDIDLFNQNKLSDSLKEKGVTTWFQLSEIIQKNEYEVVDSK